MKVKDLIKALLEYDNDQEVVIYNDSNDQSHPIRCVDADEGSSQDETPQVILLI